MCTAQPCVVVRGSLEDVKDAFLVAEKKIICKVPPIEVPLALLATFILLTCTIPKDARIFILYLNVYFWAEKFPTKKQTFMHDS